MKNTLLQTENLLKLQNYSSKTKKPYLIYIKQYLDSSKKHNLKNRQEFAVRVCSQIPVFFKKSF